MTTRPVHPLEEYIHDTFGDGFASVVLHGFQDAIGATTVCLTFDGVCETWEMLNKTLLVLKPQGEIWGFKPLVLSALLKLLLNQQKIKSVLNFSCDEVLQELMWPNTSATRREIEDSIGFYFSCYYSRVKAPHLDESQYEIQGLYRLITHYRYEGFLKPQSDLFDRGRYDVFFEDSFINELRQGRVRFAGMYLGRSNAKLEESQSEQPASDDISGQKETPGKINQRIYPPLDPSLGPPMSIPNIKINIMYPVFWTIE